MLLLPTQNVLGFIISGFHFYSHTPNKEKKDLPCGSVGKESTCNMGDLGSNSALGMSSRERKGYPLQYSGLENSIDCIVHWFAELDTTERLSLHNRKKKWLETGKYISKSDEKVCLYPDSWRTTVSVLLKKKKFLKESKYFSWSLVTVHNPYETQQFQDLYPSTYELTSAIRLESPNFL